MTGFVDQVAQILQARTCIVGMGNPLLGNDGAGVYIVESLKKTAAADNISLLTVEDVLENYIFQIARRDCDYVLLIDAVRAGSPVGTVVFGKVDEMDEKVAICSTHKPSLMLSHKILQAHNKNSYLIGIEAGEEEPGDGLCPAMQKSADLLIATLTAQMPKATEERQHVH